MPHRGHQDHHGPEVNLPPEKPHRRRRHPLSHIFKELLDNRDHILLVVDNYGGTEGIVTLEDVVETLIGIEIVDEADQIDDMRRLARRKWQERMERLGIDVREGDVS